MKLNCEVIQDLVSVYNDGIASEGTMNAVKEHLADCADCKKFYKYYNKESEPLSCPKPEKCATLEWNEKEKGKYITLSNLLKRNKRIKNSSLVAMTALIATSAAINVVLFRKIRRDKEDI